MARKVTFGAACSLDLYIAHPDSSYGWIMHTSEANEVMAGYWKTIDTILMGRKTWEVAQKSGHFGVHPGMNVHPVLLGSGVPMFHAMPRQVDLERLDCRPFRNGCVYVLYAVRRARPAAAKRPARPTTKRRAAKK